MVNLAEHEIFPAITVKMLTIVGVLTFMNLKNSFIGKSAPEKQLNFFIFYTYEHLKLHAQLIAA